MDSPAAIAPSPPSKLKVFARRLISFRGAVDDCPDGVILEQPAGVGLRISGDYGVSWP